MHVGITYDFATSISQKATAKKRRPSSIESRRSTRSPAACRNWDIRSTASVGRVNWCSAWRPATAGTWSSTSAKASRAWRVKARCRRSWRSSTFRIRLVIRWSCRCVCTKALAKMVVERAGLPTPEIASHRITRRISTCPDWLTHCLPSPWPKGRAKGITAASRITTRDGAGRRLQSAAGAISPARPGRGVLCRAANSPSACWAPVPRRASSARSKSCCCEQAEPGVYSYVNKEKCEELVEYHLVGPEDAEVRMAEQIALAAWRALGGRDAGRLDLRSDRQGVPHFMEANPLAGMHPSHSDLPMLATAVGHDLRRTDRPDCRIGARASESTP